MALCFASWAQAATESEESDLALYRSSILVGIHDHGQDDAYRKLIAAERDFSRRLSVVRIWLIANVGQTAVDQIDQQIEDDMGTVSWARGPTFEEEEARLRAAQLSLAKLERRMMRWTAENRP